MLTPTQDYPQAEIVAESPQQTRLRLARVKSKEARKEAQLHRLTSTEYLDVGVKVYPDVGPGVGWVLDRYGKAPRYYATKELAVAKYWELVKKGEG